MPVRDLEDWTISRWRLEPRLKGLELDDLPLVDQPPALWQDLALASVVALLLWVAAAAVFA
jgi:hypothetical protein